MEELKIQYKGRKSAKVQLSIWHAESLSRNIDLLTKIAENPNIDAESAKHVADRLAELHETMLKLQDRYFSKEKKGRKHNKKRTAELLRD